MPTRASSIVAAAWLGGLFDGGSAHGAVGVTVEPPTVVRVEFAARRPPPDMPADPAERGGLCHSVFELETGIASSIELLSPTTVRAYPGVFDIVTRLKVTIYTPRNAPARLREHEEGHRQIAEHYYRNAESAAREAAAEVQSRSFEAHGADRESAEKAVGELIRAAMRDAFMKRVHARSAAANARYDAITRHGLDPIEVSDAVVRAIAQDP